MENNSMDNGTNNWNEGGKKAVEFFNEKYGYAFPGMKCRCGGKIIYEHDIIEEIGKDVSDMILVKCDKCGKPHVFKRDIWEILNK